MEPATWVRLLIGLPLLAHLGYLALTSLPMGAVPGKPVGAKQERRNQELRSSVIGFLNEVRRVEDFAQRARTAGWSKEQIEDKIRFEQERILSAAALVVKASGQFGTDAAEGLEGGGRRLLVHDKTVQASPTSH